MALADFSVEVFERTLAREDYWSPLTMTLFDAGYTYRAAGRLDEARRLFERSLEHRETLYGPRHVKIAKDEIRADQTPDPTQDDPSRGPIWSSPDLTPPQFSRI